ncbi:MAG: hypothetical protein U1E05_17850 [Patescibacteria group bacterium]|nr:hypothetical protein [Patescibacteria group bacterium]
MTCRVGAAVRMAIAWGAAAVVTAGCGGVAAVPVSGRVTVNGQPLENVAVNFAPMAAEGAEGPGSSGVTDADGHFTLKTIGQRRANGAVVGKHLVTVSEGGIEGSEFDPYSDPTLSPQETAARLARFRYKLPSAARDGTLRFEVPPGGTAEANFSW